MKTPITYYGGKQSMLKHILPNIPEHELYTESFFGGGAVYWAKEPAKVEVINDLNGEVTNFYRQLKGNYEALDALIKGTLHSREEYEDAKVIYNNPHLFSKARRAWAFWVLTQQGFVSKIGSWGYERKSAKSSTKITNKKTAFTIELSERLERTQIECTDAVKVIKSRDTPTAFHYIDPPYVGSNQGHYKGYDDRNFERLLVASSEVKGKFLLSSYESDLLKKYTKENGWFTLSFKKQLSASNRRGAKKIEVLTANYPIK